MLFWKDRKVRKTGKRKRWKARRLVDGVVKRLKLGTAENVCDRASHLVDDGRDSTGSTCIIGDCGHCVSYVQVVMIQEVLGCVCVLMFVFDEAGGDAM